MSPSPANLAGENLTLSQLRRLSRLSTAECYSETNSMVSTKKSRFMNKHGSKVNDDCQDKDGTNSSKRKVRKRKLSEMLGSEWSKEELKCFYKAYCKYGKNWKKVAGTIRNKSSDVVEALYNINRAYLSLPKDQCSADAFVAMMTDHYNILDGSDNEQKTNDTLKTIHKPQKRCRRKLPLNELRESDSSHPSHLRNHSALSCHGCLPSSKKKHSGDVLGGTRPCAVGKRTPRGRMHYLHRSNDNISSPNKKVSKSELNSADDSHELTSTLALAGASQSGVSPQFSRGPWQRIYNKESSPVSFFERKHCESEFANTNYIEVATDVDIFEGKLGSGKANNGDLARDARRLHSEGDGAYETKWTMKVQEKKLTSPGTEYVQNNNVAEVCSSTNEGLDVEGHQLLPSDECSSFEALYTLANTAVRILSRTTAVELESSVHAEEPKGNVDSAHKSNVPGSMLMKLEVDQSGIAVNREKGYDSTFGVDVSRKSAKQGKELFDKNAPLINKIQKRKQMSSPEKVSIEEGKPSCIRKLVPRAKQGKMVQSLENSSLSNELRTKYIDLTELTTTVTVLNMPIGKRRRRKLILPKTIVQKELISSKNVGDESSHKDSSSVNNKAVDIKKTLPHCLSSRMLRRWCNFEWFYSAIDYPWFAKCEFVNYLNHVHLGHVAMLSRAEWSTIRSSLGKPRRFSPKFLLGERNKLEQYRESVRKHYSELRSGVKEGLPSDLAQPLSIGQRVIAYHTQTGEIYDGSILTIDYNHFGVRFDNSDLGFQIVKDVDCMPLNPSENVPVDIRKQNSVVDELGNSFTDGNFHVASLNNPSTKMKQIKSCTVEDCTVEEKDAVNEVNITAQLAVSHQPCTLTQIQAKEANIRALAELSHAVEKKQEELVQDRDLIGFSEHFKKDHSMGEYGLLYLRQHNGYLGDSFNTYDLTQNSGSHVAETIQSSRKKARTMVAATVQEISFLGRREVAFSKMGEAQHSVTNLRTSETISSSPYQHQPSSCTLKSATVRATSPKVHISSDAEYQVPMELISTCVATYLMIQTCAEGWYPPAKVVEILEHATASLQPCCPKNLPIYRDIERCMGHIMNQMLARVPVPESTIPAEVPM